MTTVPSPTAVLHLVVGYDGSPPASRALDAAALLMQGRTGRIDVVYVAHTPVVADRPSIRSTWNAASTRSNRSCAPRPPGSCPAAGRPGRSIDARATPLTS